MPPVNPKGRRVEVTPASLYPELDDWLSVTPRERDWIAEDLNYGKLPGDEERRTELLQAPGSALPKMQQERETFLKNNPDYTYENKKPSKTDLYLKPIGEGIVDTAKDLGQIGADLLFRGKVPTMGEIFGKTPVRGKGATSTPTQTITTPGAENLTSRGRGLSAPSLDLAQPPQDISAPPQPKKTTVAPAKTVTVPDLTVNGMNADGTVKAKTYTRLNPDDEDRFQAWYQKTAKELGLNRNPDDPNHKYDYRAFWRKGGQVDANKHFDSRFKDDDHPNRFVLQGKTILDTKYGKLVQPDQFAAIATPEQRARLEGARKPLTPKRSIPAIDQAERPLVQAGQNFAMPEPSIMDAYKVLPGMADILNMTEQRQAQQLMEMQRGGAPSPTAGIPNMEPPKPLSLGGAFEEAGKSFARGTGHTSGAILKGLGRWHNELNEAFGRKTQIDDYATVKLGKNIQKWTAEVFQGRPDLQKNFLLTTLFEGAGSSIPFLAAGAAGAATGLGPGAVASVSGALVGMDTLAEHAPANATPLQRKLGMALGGAFGALEGIPIADLFKRINLASGGLLSTSLVNGTIQGVEEAVQEWVQQFGENGVKKYVYDMLGQDMFEGTNEGAAAGGMIGFLTGFMLSGRGRVKGASDTASPQAPPSADAKNGSGPTNPTPPTTQPPDLGEIATPKPAKAAKPPKVGKIVNQEVQKIADQVKVPDLEISKEGPPKLVKKEERRAPEPPADQYEKQTTPPVLVPTSPEEPKEKPGPEQAKQEQRKAADAVLDEPLRQELQSGDAERVQAAVEEVRRRQDIPPPDTIDEDMREALDQDLDLLDEDAQSKPGRQEPEVTEQPAAPVTTEPPSLEALQQNVEEAKETLADFEDPTSAIDQEEVEQQREKVKEAEDIVATFKDDEDLEAFTKKIEAINESGVTGQQRLAEIGDVIEEQAAKTVADGDDLEKRVQAIENLPWDPVKRAQNEQIVASQEPQPRREQEAPPSLEEQPAPQEDQGKLIQTSTGRFRMQRKDGTFVTNPITGGVDLRTEAKAREVFGKTIDVTPKQEAPATPRLELPAPQGQGQTVDQKPEDTTSAANPSTVPSLEKLDPAIGPLKPGELSFEDFLKQSRFYRSGKTKNAEVPGGERVILKDEATAGNFRETSRNFLRGVYGNYIAKLRTGKQASPPSLEGPSIEEGKYRALEEQMRKTDLKMASRVGHGNNPTESDKVAIRELLAQADRAPSTLPDGLRKDLEAVAGALRKFVEPSKKTPAYKVTSAELVPTRGEDGKIKWVAKNVTEEEFPEQEAKPKTEKPSFSVASLSEGVPTPEQLVGEEQRFDGILKLAADDAEKLRSSDVDRVMEEAGEGWKEFKQWLLEKPLRQETRSAVEAWEPEQPAPPTLEALPAKPEGATLEVPALEGGPNERTEQPGVANSRPPEGTQTQPVPSLEAERPTQQVPARETGVAQRATDTPRTEGPAAARSEGDAEGRDLPAERGGRPDDRGNADAVSGSDQPARADFQLTPAFDVPTGQKTKYRANVDAIKLLKRIEAEGRLATQEEQATLAKYTGWGGLPQAFQWSREWQKEYEELNDLLTEDEYKAARASTPNAHYTDPETIRAIYTGLEHLGFKHGRVLEPGAGVGHFFGVMPSGMAKRSQRTAVELDEISARIAKQLYQNANVMRGAYQDQALPNDFFDVAVGNVPFADVRPHDKHNADLNKLNFSLHDYYFAKAISQVRQGGLVLFITSRYTMDKINGKLRDHLAKHADLVGAIRLPNTQFKAIANTDVTTDIIVLRKREEGQAPAGESWGKTGEQATSEGPAVVNEYFVRHPENIMGKLSLQGSMYRDKEITVSPDGRNVGASMIDAFRRMPASIYQPKARPVSTTPRGLLEALQASDDVKDGAYTIQNNALYVRRGNQFVPMEDATPTDIERAKGLIGIREQVKTVLKSQLEDTGEPFMAAQRKELNKIYDRFQKKFGYINNATNKRLFRDDPDYGTLQSLEKDYDRKKDTAKKADIFSKRIIEYRPRAEKADTAKEAMLVSLNETGKLDLERMEGLTGRPQNELLQELKGLVYQDPQGSEWQPAERYLAGNVRQKLKVAEAAAKVDKRFQENVDALKLAIPEDLKPEQINVKLGHGWIPTDVYRDFIAHLLDANVRSVTVNYSAAIGAFALKTGGVSSVKNTKTFGTDRASALSILESSLASQLPTVYDKTIDDKRIVNEKETLLAREKQQAIQDEFRKWIWSDPERSTALAAKYNEEYNNVRLQDYDGSHLTLPGSNPLITLRPHQKNAVWRALQEGNTLLAHEVGAGKTYTKIAIAMEARRLRMANKPLLTVPNHLVEYWRNAFLELYPAAKVLAATKEDFEAANRKKLVGKIATGDWDAIVIAHSQMSRIPMSYESFEKFATEQMEILEDYLREMKADKGGNRNIIKELEKAKARFKSKLESRKSALESNADGGVTFEQTGVDMILVDEADLFKNLWFPTRMTRVAGLPNTESQRSYDMFLKTNYLNQITGQRAVIFGTATPVSNSMAEVFTMQRYLQPKQLEEAGLAHFDAWARQFGNTVTSMELAADGSGYRPKTRFAEFVNVPELTQMFRRVMDVKTGEDLKLPVPKLRTGKPINVTVPASDALKTYVATLIERAGKLKGGQVDPREDNMLKITGDGRNAALDVRLRVPGAPEDKNGKVAAMVKQVVKEYKDSTAVNGTQLIFLDLSTPKAEDKKKNGADEESATDTDVELGEESSLRGSVYQDIKRKLLAAGIPESEVKFIHDAKTDEQKTKLFADVNSGAVRVLIGSTEKMGAGTNVQKKMVALHNLDAPWRPRDIHQRNGRGVRQGNELYLKDPDGFEFAVFNYATEAPSFDVYMWQTLEAKARTITQIMKGDPNIRTIQDVDTAVMSFAEMKAIASGNPMVIEKANKDIELRKLSLLKSAHNDTQREIAYQLNKIPNDVALEKAHIEQFVKLEKIASENPADPFSITLDATYTDKTAAGEAVIKMGQDALSSNPHRDQIISYPGVGTYRGFPVSMFVNVDNSIYFKFGDGGLLRTTDFKVDEVKPENVMTRFDNAIANLDSYMAVSKKKIATLEKKEADLLNEQKKPFEGEAKIKELEARIKEIDNALDLNKKDENVIAADQGSETGLMGMLKSERGSIPANPFAKKKEPATPGFTSSDPEIEARVRAAKRGLEKQSLRDRIKENAAHVWRLVSREFEHLPDTAQFSRLRNDLLKLAKYKGVAADEIQRELAAIVKPLNRKQYDQFEWKTLLEDLKSEAKAERSLPFGYTPEQVDEDLENLNAAISQDHAVQESWAKRQQLWSRIKRDYQASMETIGFDVSKKLTKENYFRHQVLEHARERGLKGTGAKIRTPTGRGFLKTRAGSTSDINANYVQAEFEVMAQMVYDAQLAKVIAGVDQSLNIRRQLEAQAKAQNNQALQAIVNKQDERGALVDAALKGFRKRLGMHMSRIRKALGLKKDDPLSLAEIAEIAEDLEHEASLSARGVFKVINERKVFVDEVLGEQKVEWQDLIPDTHDLWQPREGNVFYMVDSVPVKMARLLHEAMLAEVALKPEMLRKVMAIGSPREQYVIPKEAKATLDQLYHKEYSKFVEMNRHITRHWKALMLSAPRRIIRYIARNTTGDMDAMFVGNSASFKKLPRAAKELLPVIFKETVLSGEVKEWVKRGGYGTTLQTQELGNLNELKAFKVTLDRASKGGVLSIPLKAWNGYWQGARMSIDYMETMRRYAAYLSYLEQMQENNGVPKNFGASRKETVMALPDIRDRAFKLSNELLGAYDRVSVAGQTLRDFWILFYSWWEVNATRYGRLAANAFDGGQGGKFLAKGALVTGKNAAAFLVKASFLWATLQAWNYLFFEDDEDELRKTNPTVANRPHILFGRDEKGQIQYLSGIGALGDLLAWFGLDSFPGLVGDLMHDRITVGEAIQNAAKAPVNRIIQGVTPMVKLPVELATGLSSYPDAFRWRPIQDRAEYLGYQTTFGPEISALMGKPGKPLYGMEDLSGLLVQRTDPKQSAYYTWQATERKLLERMGKDSPSIFWRSPKGEALHNWAVAVRHQDAEAEKEWSEQYIAMEKEKYGSRFNQAKLYGDIEKSLRAQAPLSGMTTAERESILKQVTPQDREELARAEEYYKTVMMGVLPAARRASFQRKLQSQGWLTKGQPAAPPLASLEP